MGGGLWTNWGTIELDRQVTIYGDMLALQTVDSECIVSLIYTLLSDTY